MKTTMLSPAGVYAPETDTSIQISKNRALSADELGALTFFAGLKRADLEHIAANTKLLPFQTGEMMVCQGDVADSFYVLMSGRVRVYCNLPDIRLPVEEISAGDTVGFSWLFTPDKVHFSARAMEPVVAVFVDCSQLRGDCERLPHLGFEFAKRAGRVMLRRLEAIVAVIGGVRPPPGG